MENLENDILGFDPQQLSILNETPATSSFDNNIYHARPAESKSDDGIYRAQIKVIYNPFEDRKSTRLNSSHRL